jgi:hypothetical protein
MPRLIPFRLAVACALAFALVLASSALATDKGTPAHLRVIGSSGKVLAEETLSTGTVAVPTSSKATCFGKGTGGSGKPTTVRGATALGLLAQAAQSTSALRPLLITDHFSFGLGLCGVGGEVAHGKGFWYLKVNHKNPEVGGELVKLSAGDDVLWYLSPDYESTPGELWLQAPHRVSKGKPFQVQVFSYADDGTRSPAVGATVTGSAQPTDASGRTTVVLSKPGRLIARQKGAIPSNRRSVCVGQLCLSGRS